MKYLLGILFLFFTQLLFCQAISGKVFDAETGFPAEGVSVYFDGSSVGTITKADGYFSIDPKFDSNAFLIFSHIGYQTVNIAYDKLGSDLKIYLNEDIFQIPEVTLVSDPFSRREKLEVFRKEFLGDNKSAENCSIENEDVLELYFNSNNNVLSVYAKEPIQVVNNHLGYHVRFDLKDFKVNFREKSLKRVDNIMSTVIIGHTFFKDIAEEKSIFLERRNYSYAGSIQHFIRTLWAQDLQDESFEIREKFKKVNIFDVLEISAGSDLLTRKVTFKVKEFKITHKKDIWKHWSSLKLLSGSTISIDKYGSHMPYLQLKFGGYMASLRIGDLLPLDFEKYDIAD